MSRRGYMQKRLDEKIKVLAADIEQVMALFQQLAAKNKSVVIPQQLQDKPLDDFYKKTGIQIESISEKVMEIGLSVEEVSVDLDKLYDIKQSGTVPQLAAEGKKEEKNRPMVQPKVEAPIVQQQQQKKTEDKPAAAAKVEPKPGSKLEPKVQETKQEKKKANVPSTSTSSSHNGRTIVVAGDESESDLDQFEDPVAAHLGYQPDRPDPSICRYFNSEKGCQQGQYCEWKHIKVRGDYVLKKVEEVIINTPIFEFKINSYYLVRIIGLTNNNRVVQAMLLDSKPLTKEQMHTFRRDQNWRNVSANSEYLRNYCVMMANLSKEYSKKEEEPTNIFPAIGSLVAVPENEDGERYERARVIDVDLDARQVTLKHLESGSITTLPRSVVFNLTQEYTLLPQLVNDFLLSKDMSPDWLNDIATINPNTLLQMAWFAKIESFAEEDEPIAFFSKFDEETIDSIIYFEQQFNANS